MADLSQEELRKLYNNASDKKDDTESVIEDSSQEELRALYNAKPSIMESFTAGFVNQANTLPKILGTLSALQSDSLNDRWGAKKQAPMGIDEDTWKKASTSEKYNLVKDLSEFQLQNIADAHPVADAIGNMVGSAAIPSGAGIGGSVATKLGAKGFGKLAGVTLGSAGEGALQSASFSRGDNALRDAGIGAAIGAALPVAGAGIGKAIKGGKVASKYVERADEIKEARKNPKTAGEMFEENLKNKADEIQAKAENEAIDFSDAFRKDTEKAIERGQVLDEELVDTTLALQKGQRKLMSEESTKGWDALSTKKDINVKPLVDKLENAYKNFEANDPNAKRLKVFLDELKNGEQTISEVDLKKKINRYWNEISETEVTKNNRGVWIPLSSRELMGVADTARDMLINKNKAYAAIVEPLGKKVEKFKRLASILKLDRDDATILKRLKQHKSDKQIRDAITEFKEVTGTDLIPMIEKADSVKLSATSPEFKKDLVNIIVNKNSKDTDYKKLVKGLEEFDKENGTNYAQMLNDIRTNNMVETLQKANKFLTIGDKQQVSKLDALFGNIIPVDLKPAKDSPIERILFKGQLQDQAKIKNKDDNTRKLLRKFSEFMGQDADKNLRAIENENLYDLMGTSQANGSRRVNLGANLGEYIYEGLKKIPVAGKAVGALGGAIIDNGMFQRGRRELLELLSRFEKNQTPTWRPDNNILNKINTRIVAPQVTKDLDRQDLSYEMLNPITGLASRQSVERQQDTNLKNFGRTG